MDSSDEGMRASVAARFWRRSRSFRIVVKSVRNVFRSWRRGSTEASNLLVREVFMLFMSR